MRSAVLCLLGLASVASAANLSESSCMLIAGFASFDLRSLQPTKEGGEVQYYSSPSGQLTWTMCNYIKFTGDMPRPAREADKDMFAYLLVNNTVVPLTTGVTVLPWTDGHYNMTTNESVLDGLTYTYHSTQVCPFNSSRNMSFSNTVICNHDITGDGKGQVKSVTGEDSCHPAVTMEHESGCSVYNFSGFVKFLDENAWLSGTVLVILGAVLVFIGRQFFFYIMAVLATIIGFCAVMYLATLFGWLNATWSLIIMIVIAVAAGLALGYLFFTTMKLTIGLMGAACGVLVGAALYSVLLAITTYDALWLIIVLLVAGGITGGILAFRWSDVYLSFCTSFIGGYMFMRGTTFYFGEYPSEMEMFSMMVNGENLQLQWQFWLYFAAFVAVAVFGFIWQTVYHKNTDDKIDHYYKQQQQS